MSSIANPSTFELSRGAFRLFNMIHTFIHKYGSFFAGQEWIARKMRAGVRSVQRWTGELIAGGFIARDRRSQRTATYRILKDLPRKMAGQMAGQMAGHIKGINDVTLPTVEQNQPDEFALEPIRKAAGIETLSESDRRMVQKLESSGTSRDQIKAGIVLARARNLASPNTQRPRSLAYFANAIEEAKQLPAGYIEHCERWINRHTEQTA